MQTFGDFLDSVKARHGLPSDRQLSFFLKMDQPTLTGYRKGRKVPGEKLCFRIAELLDVNGAYVLACVKSEHSDSLKMRNDWLEVAEKFAATA